MKNSVKTALVCFLIFFITFVGSTLQGNSSPSFQIRYNLSFIKLLKVYNFILQVVVFSFIRQTIKVEISVEDARVGKLN